MSTIVQVIVVVMERREFSEIAEPEKVYAIRFVDDTTPKSIDLLMKSLARQLRRYPGFEKMTPIQMCNTLDVRVYRHVGSGFKTWPYFLGYMHRDRERKAWYW